MTVGFLVVLISCANVAALLLGRAPRRSREVALRTALGRVPAADRPSAPHGGWRARRPRRRRRPWRRGPRASRLSSRHARRAASPTGSLIPSTRSCWPPSSASRSRRSSSSVSCRPLTPAGSTLSGRCAAVPARTGARRGLGRWTTGFVAAEVALTVVLLFQAAVAARSVQDRLPSDTAVESEDVLAATVTVQGRATTRRRNAPGFTVRSWSRRGHFLASRRHRWRPRCRASGQVEQTLLIEGRAAPAEGHARVAVVHIGGRYFETLALPVVNGRDFADGDTVSAQPVAIVNERFARTLFADADPVGTRIALHSPGDRNPAPVWRTIVGVVPDIRQRSAVRPIVYTAMPAGQAATASLLGPPTRGRHRTDGISPGSRVQDRQRDTRSTARDR